MSLDPASRALDDQREHRAPVVPVVVPERVFVEVHLQVLGRHRVVDAADAALQERPEAFDGVRMNVPADVDVLRVWTRE